MYTILFISSSMGGGGAERALSIIINNVDRNIFKPYLALYKKEGFFLDSLEPDICITELQPKDQGILFRNLSRGIALTHLCSKIKPDLIVSFQWHVNVVTLLTTKFARLKIPVIINEQGTPDDRTDRRRRLLWPIFKYCYRLSNHLIVLSAGLALRLKQDIDIQDSKISVIHNPVVTSTPGSIQDRIAKNIKQNYFTLISAGRLVKTKNFPWLLNAFAQISKTDNVELIILGDGPEREDLENLSHYLGIQNKVHFMGFQKDIMAYFKKADLFILPSLHEPFGNVIIEAMSCGLPIIAADCPYGPREILDNEHYGKLIPVNDVDSLAMSIHNLLHNPKEREYLAQLGIIRAKDFSAEKITAKYQNLFLVVINGFSRKK